MALRAVGREYLGTGNKWGTSINVIFYVMMFFGICFRKTKTTFENGCFEPKPSKPSNFRMAPGLQGMCIFLKIGS
jgi:hypothetical protein